MHRRVDGAIQRLSILLAIQCNKASQIRYQALQALFSCRLHSESQDLCRKRPEKDNQCGRGGSTRVDGRFCSDNWYTSLPLAHNLLKSKIDLVGTLGRNRKGIPQMVRDKKLQRGEFIYKQNSKGVPVLKWRDKKEIYMLSTKHDASCHPNGKPTVVADYNRMKGFVDPSNQMAAYSPFVRKTAKWYIRLFFHLITQTALFNA